MFRLGGVKTAKSNKNEKTEEVVAMYQEAECLWNELSKPNLRQMALTQTQA